MNITHDDATVSVCIRDYGPGIPPAELPQVKKKFFKGSSKERGSGIGLAVCDEIVTRHNGTLDIANAAGGGVRVTVDAAAQGILTTQASFSMAQESEDPRALPDEHRRAGAH